MFKKFCQNYYVLKNNIYFSNDVKYYIFYQDKETDAGICGIITNKQYQLLTDPDEYPDRWCEDNYKGFEHIFTEELLEDDKYLQQIYQYFDSNYQAVTHINSDDAEYLLYTKEIMKRMVSIKYLKIIKNRWSKQS